MWLAHIFGHDVAVTFGHILSFSDDSDAFAAACSVRLHDVHVLETTDFPVAHPPLVVLREDVRGGSDIESLAMQTSHALYIAPHVVFPADGPGAGEVVEMLLHIHVPQAALSEQACPADVPRRASHVPETSHFQGVHHAVVSVRAVRDLEAWCAVRFQLVLRVLNDAREVARQVALGTEERWVWKEDVRLTRRERALDHGDYLVGRPLQKFIPNCIFTLLLGHACHAR